MIYNIADNITSPLGMTTKENLEAVRQGKSALRLHQLWDIPEPFMASLFPERETFENVALTSIREALSQVPELDVTSERVGLVLASTKGNTTSFVDETGAVREGRTFGESSAMIARALGLSTKPMVVSNACISGLSAQILAARMIESGRYDTVIVCGCDIISKFIVAGFQSFKSLSQSECRPFDEDRNGLNLGEAAATIVYSRFLPKESRNIECSNNQKLWTLSRGAIRNDAFHISGPSQIAEGSFRALQTVLEGEKADDLALINAHGTATLYNDDMESIAIQRASLLDVPVNSLKGYFGHTLGAAGVLETILTMHSTAEGWTIGTRGFAAGGTYYDLNVSAEHAKTEKTSFVKLMSGFGGCNAAALFKLCGATTALSLTPQESVGTEANPTTSCQRHVSIHLSSKDGGADLLTRLYKEKIGGYPKFYKMDPLARLGFVASELLLQKEQALAEESGKPCERFVARDDRAIILINRSASHAADQIFEKTLAPDNYFPSPAEFVYTLPNIVTGEIALRNKYHGETSFLCVDDKAQVEEIIALAFLDGKTTSVLGGWLECSAPDDFEAELSIFCKN